MEGLASEIAAARGRGRDAEVLNEERRAKTKKIDKQCQEIQVRDEKKCMHEMLLMSIWDDLACR